MRDRLSSVTFAMAGPQYIAFSGSPHFKLTESFSLFVSCENQAEVDHFWNALIADGGAPSKCGWLKGKFGVTWRIVPKTLVRLLGDKDSATPDCGIQAMMAMTKTNVAELERAAAGDFDSHCGA